MTAVTYSKLVSLQEMNKIRTGNNQQRSACICKACLLCSQLQLKLSTFLVAVRRVMEVKLHI